MRCSRGSQDPFQLSFARLSDSTGGGWYFFIFNAVPSVLHPVLPVLPLRFRSGGRIVANMPIVPLIMLAVVTCWAADAAVGTWKLNAARSTFAGDTQPKSLIVRIEPHAKARWFTLDRPRPMAGRQAPASYCISMARLGPFRMPDGSGTQSSRRLDRQTVEIFRDCASGQWTRLIRRSVHSNELILEITEQRLMAPFRAAADAGEAVGGGAHE